MINRFSHWVRWRDRNKLQGIRCPGVYAIALSGNDISLTSFACCNEIIYFGMTNSAGGLKSRLQQFDNTINGKEGHGGAMRVRFKYRNYRSLVSRLFVSVSHIECDVLSGKPSDIRLMGEVARQEYECLALFVETFGRSPEFNDKKKSRKK